MADVFCGNADCIYCEPNDNICTAQIVTIDENGKCEAYEAYESNEPKEPYWKRCFDKKINDTYRKKAYGYRIVVDGVTFFSDMDSRYKDCYRYVTEERSGVLCGTLEDAKAHIDYIKKTAPTLGSVLDLQPYYDFLQTPEETDNG